MKNSVILLLIAITQLFAVGSIYGRRPYSEEDYRPIKLKSYNAQVKINDRIAITTIEHVFQNETNQLLEGVFILPLPDDAIVTNLTIWEDGDPIDAEIMPSDSALYMYHKNIAEGLDAVLLEQLGDNVFKMMIFPIEPHGYPMSERKISITFAEVLPFLDGDIHYQFALKSLEEEQSRVDQLDISITLNSQEEMKTVSNSHSNNGFTLTHSDNFNYSGELSFANHKADENLHVTYTLSKDELRSTALTYVPSIGEFEEYEQHSYFLLSITPPDSIAKEDLLAKDIIFCVDISQSMYDRIDHLQRSISNMIEHLREGDRFNIILFSSGTTAFKTDLVEANNRNRNEAIEFLGNINTSGLTNMEQAFTEAIDQNWRVNSAQSIIFITDGVPTWPSTSSPQAVLEKVKGSINEKTALYSFGLGDDIDAEFLNSLSNNHNGFSTLISEDANIPSVMKQFITQISYPVLTDLQIHFDSDIYEVYPEKIPNLYAGTELIVLGRYRRQYGLSNASLSGNQKIRSQFNIETDLEFSPSQNNHPSVARMWAAEKIDHLLRKIEMFGQSDTTEDIIQDLGVRYSIVTKYTSFGIGGELSIMDKSLINRSKDLSIATSRSGNIHRFNIAAPKSSSPELLKVEIFDARGRVISTLMNEYTTGGNFSAAFNSKTSAAGIYFVRVSLGNNIKISRFSSKK